MRKEIIISVLIGIIITIITSFMQFGHYDTEVGSYYANGFPLKTYQMFGDAGIENNYAFIGNILIWTIIISLILFIFKKIKNK